MRARPRRNRVPRRAAEHLLCRSAEFKETLACGLEAEWENKEVQALATAHYNEMDEMGNKNGQLEVCRRPP